MENYSLIKTRNNPQETTNSLLAQMLNKNLVQAVLAPATTPYSALPMPALFSSPGDLERAAPLAPVAGISAATQAGRISRAPSNALTAAVLRPCEIRALVELHKLNQANLRNLVLVGLECLGRLENRTYLELRERNPDLDLVFYRDPEIRAQVCSTCSSCVDFLPAGAHISIRVAGLDPEQELSVSWESEQAADLASHLELEPQEEPAKHREQVQALAAEREQARQKRLESTREDIHGLTRLQEVIGDCLGCFNCQRACPICFCRECVCSREAFDRDPGTLHSLAQRPGGLRLPGDLTMFHLTRMAHMAHACVGCGQCSSVCPSGIPLADIFRSVGSRTQQALGYEPGRSPEDPIPFLNFSQEGSS